MSRIHSFFATTPKSMECFLVDELKSLGVSDVREARAGVTFHATIAQAYKVCLWSRIANRVLFPIGTFLADTPESLYEGVLQIPWQDHVKPAGSIAVDFNSISSKIQHSHYGALKVKDAVADYFRERCGQRPSVDTRRPDLRINVVVKNDEATVSIDFSGESLHRRGYRLAGSKAPLKENLAAAILIRSHWLDIAKQDGAFIDPLCGSGTLVIEAAMMAANIAPGILREYFGFMGWLPFDAALFDSVKQEAEVFLQEGVKHCPPLIGFDIDGQAIKNAHSNAERAGLGKIVHFEKQDLNDCRPYERMIKNRGLIVTNPPYGERLGELRSLQKLYAELGQMFKIHFKNWPTNVLTGNVELGKYIGIRSHKKRTFYNGALECQLLQFEVTDEWIMQHPPVPENPAGLTIAPKVSEAVEPFVNRIKKNKRVLKSWLKTEGVQCYRIYDQDLPEFSVAVDIYGDAVHVQEYAAPKTIDPNKAKRRLQDVINALPVVLECQTDKLFLKVRQKQKGANQYKQYAQEQNFQVVQEYNCQFLVNFTDYLDVGLFLDHRITRRKIGEMAKGKRFLNLFCYTGAATIHAAKGGAKSTTSVDMSKHYIEWAKKNATLNQLGHYGHKFIVDNCLSWIERDKQQYDLIFLDPPTFSNSKKMDGTFDVQRDHVALIKKVMARLARGGVLIFSNNYQRFKIDADALSAFDIEDWTASTIPPDFKRRKNIHNCWAIKKRI